MPRAPLWPYALAAAASLAIVASPFLVVGETRLARWGAIGFGALALWFAVYDAWSARAAAATWPSIVNLFGAAYFIVAPYAMAEPAALVATSALAGAALGLGSVGGILAGNRQADAARASAPRSV